MEIENKVLIFLSFIDSLHDFFKLDKNKICFTLLKNFYNHTFNNIFFDEIFNTDIKQILSFNTNVNDVKNRELIKNFIFYKIPRNGIDIEDLHLKIIQDFNSVFDVILKKFNNFTSTFNLNTLLSDKHKILFRQTIYFLIQNYDENVVDFILDYMNINKNIYNDSVLEFIKKKIKTNLKKKKFNHITYPITYFNDTTTGFKNNTFLFNIINFDKNFIDSALVTSPKTQFNNYSLNKFNNQLFINDTNHILGFTIDRNKDKISLLGFDFYLEKNLLTCSHDNIKLYIKKNSVGRNVTDNNQNDINQNNNNQNNNNQNDNNGIYQITNILLLFFKNIFDYIKNNQLINLQSKIQKMIKYNENIKNIIKNIRIQIRKINLIDFNDDIIINTLFKLFPKRKNYSQKLINQYKTKIEYLKKNYLDILKINNFNKNNITSINNLIQQFNEIIPFLNLIQNNLNYTQITPIIYNNYYYLLSQFNNVITDDNININDNGFLLLFFDEIYKNINELIKFFYIKNLYTQLYNIYKKYLTLELCQGCIIFIMFGFKRFGDWIQVYLSNKFYFMLETNDFYCKLYSYLVGAPVIFDKMIYNYDLIKIKPDIDKDLFKIINTNEKISNYTNNDTILYRSLRNIHTHTINRFYFNKYIKYKKKYLKLKSLLYNKFNIIN